MVSGDFTPGWSLPDQALLQTAAQLLKAGQYEQVVEVLRDAQSVMERRGDAPAGQLLAMAERISRACIQSRAEMQWHQHAYSEAEQRERELQIQLGSLLLLMCSGKEAEAMEPSPVATSAALSHPTPAGLKSLERPGFLRRIKGLAASLPSLRSIRQDVRAACAEAPAAPPVEQDKHCDQEGPFLTVYCLGSFRVYQNDEPIVDWPSGKGKCILKYMIGNRDRSIPKDVLMDLFWHNADPEAARNSLNVAMYGLRQALRAAQPDFPHVLFQNDHYLLNPAMVIWVDVEEFVKHYQAAQSAERIDRLTEAIREYEVAEGLYQGDFLEEDLYEDWPMAQREGLRDSYLITLDRLSRHYLETRRYGSCIHRCQQILAKDDCREDAHRRLMRCYSRQASEIWPCASITFA
jgi:DNA-binding SARP family transcriptional activator